MENPKYKELLAAVIKEGDTAHQKLVHIGHTPAVLLDLPEFTIVQLPLVITGKVIDKVIYDHGINQVMLERLYTAIATPKAVYRSDTTGGTAVVVTLETRPVGLPVIVALHPGKMLGRKVCNVIASVYAKESEIETRWRAKGLLLWEKEE